MKQFDLREWLANPERKVQTRTGVPVRIICTDKKATSIEYNDCVVALLGGSVSENIMSYDVYGRCCDNGREHPLDLFFVPVEHTGYIVLYKTLEGIFRVGATVYNTEAEAKAQKRAKGVIKITWEE